MRLTFDHELLAGVRLPALGALLGVVVGDLEALVREAEVAAAVVQAEAGLELAEAVGDEALELLLGVDAALEVDPAEDPEDVGPGLRLVEEDEVLVGVAVVTELDLGSVDEVPEKKESKFFSGFLFSNWESVAYQDLSLILVRSWSSSTR